MNPKISLFASSIRPQLWDAFFNSFEGTTIECEVVFAGPLKEVKEYPNLKYIKTANIKPAQCYEVARRACTGELIMWVADDCEFPNDVLGNAYRYWQEQNYRKLLLSVQTKENYYGHVYVDMNIHRFFGGKMSEPLMAPLGLMSREYLEELGGIDRRYICGQYENDIAMRVYADGGRVEIFGDRNCYVDIDHERKHGGIRAGDKRSFGAGYPTDRKVLESSWTNGRERILEKRRDEFEPFKKENILTNSQSNNLTDWWV